MYFQTIYELLLLIQQLHNISTGWKREDRYGRQLEHRKGQCRRTHHTFCTKYDTTY